MATPEAMRDPTTHMTEVPVLLDIMLSFGKKIKYPDVGGLAALSVQHSILWKTVSQKGLRCCDARAARECVTAHALAPYAPYSATT